MATVPRVTDITTRVGGIQGGQQRQETNAGAFGANTAAATTALGQTAVKVATDFQNKYDEASAKNADTEFAKRAEEIRNRVMQSRGANAISGHDKALEDLRKARGDIESKLENDSQREMFIRAADARTLSSTRVFNNHLNREHENYQNEASAARIENQKREAGANFADGRAAKVSIAVGVNELRDMGKRNGWSADKTKFEVGSFESESHAGVIAAKITANDYNGAREWFAANGDKLTPKVKIRIESALKESGLRQRSQNKADEILGKTTLTDKQLEQLALDIKDPELRDATLSRVRSRIDRNLQLDKRAKAEVDDRVLSKIYNGEITTRDDINPTDLAGMSTRGLNAVKNMLKKGFRPESDPGIWLSLFNMQSDDPDAFRKLDLKTFMDKLSRSDIESFKKTQVRMQATPDANKYQTQTLQQQIKTALDEAKVDAKGNSGKAERAKFTREVSERVAVEQRAKKRKLEPEERSKIINRLMLKVPGNLYGSDRLFTFLGTPNEADAFTGYTVPEDAKASIIKQLKARGMGTSNDYIRILYLRSLGTPEAKLRQYFPQFLNFKADYVPKGSR